MLNLHQKLPRFWKHVLFWLLYFAVQAAVWMQFFEKEEVLIIGGQETIVRSGLFENYWAALKSECLESLGKLLAVYINLYVLIPRFLLKKRFLAYGVTIVLVIGISSLLQGYWAKYVLFPIFFPGSSHTQDIINFVHYIRYFAISSSVVIFTASLKILQHFYRQQNNATELAKQKLDTELNFLKNQINPHFFFNTLNNLYALALQKSNETPEMLLKLSDLMHYLLYESKAKTIDLQIEIDFIEHYLALEKLRFGDFVHIEFNKDIRENVKIPPLLLLPFVENAFKHGLRPELQSGEVFLTLQVDKHILFQVENTVPANDFSAKKKGGLGLENLKRRLELLYPSLHELRTAQHDQFFSATLKILNNEVFIG